MKVSMSIESALKKDGIVVIKKMDTLKVNSIARIISSKICETFPHLDLSQNELFIKLSRLDMYIANMPKGMSEASYFYKNSSIYFNSSIDEDNIEGIAIHECIHYLQAIKDKKNYLLKMGLCDYTEFRVYGLALNEAAVQLMTSKIVGEPKDYVKYFNISFETNSSLYYPLECCLVNQLSYITGENILFDSTLKSNDDFKFKLADLIGRKAFMSIQASLDNILSMEEKIIKINNKIAQIDDRNKKVDNMITKIDNLKRSISNEFFKTQNLIITSYFDREFEKTSTIEELNEYRRNLYSFKDYLASTDGYTFFNDYYVDKMMMLEQKYNFMENGEYTSETQILPRKYSKFLAIIGFIRNLVKLNNSEKENRKSENN